MSGWDPPHAPTPLKGEGGFGAGKRLFRGDMVVRPSIAPLSPAVTVVVRPSAEVPEGTKVTLSCRDVGAPLGTVYSWYKNGRWLTEGLDAFLILPAARRTDAGAYACQAGRGLRGRRAPPAALRVLCE